ncbi:MAG: DUF362 domain-containing protein [Spirochaetales bacterium]|nr:DUF362 domain-containing protein [Spirochaetales bacterium]
MKKGDIKSILSGILLFSMIFTLTLHLSECTGTGKPINLIPRKLPVSQVAIVQSSSEQAEDITYPEIRTLVKQAVELAGGFESLISDGDTIVLKPNLVTINDYTLPGWQGRPLPAEANGVTTDYRITKAVVELIREINPTGIVSIMEGSSVPTEKAFEHFNYTHESIPGVDEFLAIENDSGAFRDWKSPGLVKVPFPEGLLHDAYYYNKKYYEADVLISLPCLKNHWSAIVTGSIKNLGIGATPGNVYGNTARSPGRNSMVNHDTMALHYWLHDYFMARPADFVIMDGLQGIQNGPTPCFTMSGTTSLAEGQMNMRLILAGRDSVAVDTIESLLMGWDPFSVPYLRLLNADGVGNIDTSAINVVGAPVDGVRKVFKGNVTNSSKGKVIEDRTPPEISIQTAELDHNTLRVNLKSHEDLHFVRFFLGGKPIETIISGNFDTITIDLDDSFKNATELTIEAYDIYLNASRQTINLPYAGDDRYTAKKTTLLPVIDGIGDDSCWQTGVWYPIKELWLGEQPEPEDFSGQYKLAWSEDKLYVLAEITDDILRDIHPSPLVDYYKDDCLEVFIDADASGGIHTYNYNAFAYHISLTYDVADLGNTSQPRLYNDHIETKRVDKGTLSTWEIAVTLYDDSFIYDKENPALKLYSGMRLGFAIAYCDNDSEEDRESFIGSIKIQGENKNIAWMNADVFGSLTLVE